MILDNKVIDSASESLSNGKFRVANNSVMQQILSSFLYSDRTLAVVREYSINACEAHQVVGCPDKPIKVHLPTIINPKFIVRDFGPGLSKEELENLFTVYGLSTKRQSNDFTGGFGIGSKCGYAYSDSFTVCSYFNGIKYIIVNSKNNRGEFCYNVLDESKTDEPNGIEIIIDVKTSDINQFIDRAKTVYRWFKVTPQTNIPLDLKQSKVEFEENEYKIYNLQKSYYDKNYIVMGQAAYPIEESYFDRDDYKTILSNIHFTIHLNVNEVSISPSRESLQYNKFTIDKIKSVLDKIKQHFKKDVEDNLNKCKTLFEARKLVANKYVLGYINKIIAGPIKWKDNVVPIIAVYQTPKHKDEIDPNTSTVIHGNRIYLKSYKYDYGNVNSTSYKDVFEINLKHNNIKFAVYEKGGYEASNRFILENKDVLLYLVQEEDKTLLAQDLGFDESEYLYTSSFPKAVRKTRVKVQNDMIYAYRYIQSYTYSRPRSFWKTDQIDLNKETGYYCPLKEFSVNNIHPNLFLELSKNKNIIGVLNRNIKKIENNSNWKDIKEFYKEKLDSLYKNRDVQKFYDFTFDESIKKIPLEKILKNGKLKKDLLLIKQYHDSKKLIDEFKSYEDMYKKLGGTLQNTFVPIKVDFDIKKYPLLEYISSEYYDKPEVVEYINNKMEKENE